MKYREGKSFLANPKIFKSSASLYFPNLHGTTLASKSPSDTTPVLKGKVSVVSVWSSLWGENQVKSFTGRDSNPELQQFVSKNKKLVQRVDVHIEENVLKAWLVALFQSRLRSQRAEEDWGKYFIVRKGINESIRETIGILNGRVGYVYLLDEECKIRWAASGNAEGGERETMMRGLQKLVENAALARDAPKAGRTSKDVDAELEAQAGNAGAS
jgi:ATPase complex subunit ATP10